MNSLGDGAFDFTIPSIQSDFQFQFSAAGFLSINHSVSLVERPELIDLQVVSNYPAHTNIPSDTFQNVGSFTIPEGTTISWSITSSNADHIYLTLDDFLFCLT